MEQAAADGSNILNEFQKGSSKAIEQNKDAFADQRRQQGEDEDARLDRVNGQISKTSEELEDDIKSTGQVLTEGQNRIREQSEANEGRIMDVGDKAASSVYRGAVPHFENTGRAKRTFMY